MALHHRTVEGSFAAEVSRDLREPLTEDEIASLRALYDRHRVLVFRDQDLDDDQHRAAMALFGQVIPGDAGEVVHYVSNVPGEGSLGKGEILFHSDLSFSPEPFLGISLYGIDVETDASSTRYADCVGAVRLLPDGLRARLEGLRAVNALDFDMTVPARPVDPDDPGRVNTTWPAIRSHPRTGEPMLFVNQLQTVLFEGLSREETLALLDDVFAVLYSPANVYEHRWRKGDLVVWDNLAVQHARGDVAGVGRRTLRRVLTGTKTYEEQHGDALAQSPGYAAFIERELRPTM